MKRLVLTILAVLLASPVYASSTLYSNSSSVGIGTTTPANTLDVYGTGVHIQSGVPTSTSMALYNNSGTLTWNGSVIGTTGSSISGTTNYVPYFTGSASIGNSVIYQSGSDIGIGNTSPGALLDIGAAGTTLGTLRLEGNTSGYLQIQPAAAAGSWTMTLPSTAGTNGYVLQTDGSGNTSWVTPSSGAGASSSGQLKCSGSNCGNSTGSGTIQYCPYKGNTKTTASQGNYTIPSACLSATLTSMYVGGTGSSSVSASTLYYIYLWNHSGTWVLDAETTGHETDSSTGIEIMSGDSTKTLVGMIHTDASKHVMTGGKTVQPDDTNTVATWDNRIPTVTQCGFTNSRTYTHSASPTEINSENRCYFMSWGDAASFSSWQFGYVDTTGALWTTELDLSTSQYVSGLNLNTTATYSTLAVAPNAQRVTEGFAYTILKGNTISGATVTLNAGGANNPTQAVYSIQ